MVGRGENVGTAYVRIIADGTGLNKSIRDQFNDADSEFKKAGARNSKAYHEAFEEESSKGTNQTLLRKSITDTLAKGDWLEQEFFKGQNWKQFQSGLARNFGKEGRLAGENLEKALAEGMSFEQLQKRIEDLRPELAKAYAQINQDHAAALREDNTRMKALGVQQDSDYAKHLENQRRLIDSHLKYIKDRDEAFSINDLLIGKDQDRELDAHLAKQRDLINAHLKYVADRDTAFQENEKRSRRRHLDLMAAYAENERRTIKSLTDDYDRLTAAVKRIDSGNGVKGDSRSRLLKDIRDLAPAMAKAGENTAELGKNLVGLEKTLRFATPRLSRANRFVGELGDITGKSFGKGSRNNFINFIGSAAGGLVNLLQVGPRVLQFFANMGNKAGAAFEKVIGEGGSKAAASLAAIGSVAAQSAIGIGVLGAAFVGMLTIVGPLIAAISLLTGAITALVASLSFALVGAVVALAGALGVLAVAVGVGVVAFTSLSAKAKAALKVDLKPLVSAFKDLGKEAGKGLFRNVGRDAKELAPVVRSLEPLFRRVGAAIGDVGTYFTKALSGPGFKTFRREMTAFLPDAVRKLGIAFGNALGGIGGLFRASIPSVTNFLDWLDKVTGKFAAFANSPEGQEKIKKFFDDARESASKLWGWLGQVKDLLGEILGAGRGTGDNIFKSLGDNVQRFTEYLNANPDALANWFRDSGAFIKAVGDATVAIGELFDAFDNETTRGLAIAFFKAIGEFAMVAAISVQVAVGLITGAVDLVKAAFRGFPTGNKAAGGLVTPFFPVPGAILSRLTPLPGLVGAIFRHLPDGAKKAGPQMILPFGPVGNAIISRLAPLVPRVGGLMSRVPPLARKAAQGMPGFFASVPGRIGGLVAPVVGRVAGLMNRLPGTARAIIGALVGPFAPVVGRIIGHLASLPSRTRSLFNQMVSAAASIPGRIASLFSGLAGRIISAVGTINLPTPHISMPKIPHISIPGLATGGLVEGIRGMGVLRRVGEAGPEAVVPLNRPLNQVDPAVRWLSAIAQGKIPAMASGGTVGTGRQVTFESGAIQVITPNSDARAVATQVVNRIVAVGY